MCDSNTKPLDDSGDPKSRLWRLTWCIAAWHAAMLPLAIAFDLVSVPKVFVYLQWLILALSLPFGGIKLAQKVAGAVVEAKKEGGQK